MNRVTYFQRVGSFGLYQRSIPLDWMSWPSPHLQSYTSILNKCTQCPVFFKKASMIVQAFLHVYAFHSALWFFWWRDVTEYITCMKFLYSHNLTWNISHIYRYWLLLFSRLSKLEKETRICLESGTQTEQEEESSEAVSSCPRPRYNNIQLACWGHQPQGLDFHLHSGSKGQLSCTGNGSELWYILEMVPNYSSHCKGVGLEAKCLGGLAQLQLYHIALAMSSKQREIQ